MKQPFETIEVV